MAKQIKYSVGFDIKQSDLNTLKANLQQLKKLSLSDLMKINQSDRAAATQTFTQIREQAENVQQAIKAAFNAKLNTVNIETFNKSLKQAGSSVQQVYETFKKGGVAGQNAFRSLTSQVLTTNVQLKQTHTLLDNIATTLANTIKWNIASSAVNTLSNSVQQAWGYVKSLDTSLNDIRIVTGKSADEMANFAVQANQAAQSLGKTTVDYTKAALIYAQQGLSDDEIAARAAITLKAANVTGQSTDEVSEQLTSVWNGYKVTAEEAELYIDRLAAVAASTASDLEQLSTGMSKVASAAAAMGVGEDQLAAQLSTIISVTRQAPESVGTALRTIYARISDIKAGIDEDGVSLGNYSGKMAALGFNVLDVNGKLRDMGEVIEEIGGKWQTLTREQQVSLAQTMAGQRQYSNLIALFDNFQEYNRALNIAQNAAGTLQEQQDTYLESTRAHLNQLKTAVEDLYDSLLNPDSLEPLIDGLAKAASFGAKFVDSLGGGGTILTSLGAIGISVFSEQIAKGINTTITNFEIAKRNAQQFDAILQTIQQWKGIEGLDQSTKSLLQSRQQILNLSKLMTPEQFSGMQGLLNDITETGNRLAAIKDQKGLFESQLKEIGGIKDQWKDFNNILKDAEAQESIKKNLQEQENEFTNATNQLKAYGDSIRQTLGRQGTATTDIATLKNNIGQYLKNLERLSTTNGSFKNHAQQISNLRKEFDNLNNIPESELPAKLSQITASMEGLYTNGANAAQGLREKLVEEFAETARSLGHSEKQIEDLLNKLVKSFQTSQKQIERATKIKGITNLLGSFSQIGAAINQIQHLGSIFKNSQISGAQKALTLLTNGLPSLIMGIKGVTSAATAMGAALGIASGGITIILGLLTAGAAALGIFAQAQKQARQEAIKTSNAIIEEENKKQEQIENNKKLYTSIEDLNKKYSQGKITRNELKSQVEDLIDQYDLESIAANRLRQNYDNLTESIKAAREEAARESKKSADREKGKAQQLVLDTANEGFFDIGTKKGKDQYQLALSPGYSAKDEPDFIKNLFKASGAQDDGDGYLVYNVDFNTNSIVQLYDTVDRIVEVIQKTDQLTDAQKNDSEFYQDAVKWLKQMQDSIEKYRQALNDVSQYTTELTAITSQAINLENIQNANQYIEERKHLIEQIQKMLDKQGNTNADATAMADAYLNENYRELYNQYNQALQYITKLRQKFRSSDSEIESLIASLDQESLGYLKKFYDLDDISQWKQLESIIKFLINPNNAERLTELSTAVSGGSFESAQSTYDLYSSLSDQIASSKNKTISKKEFEKLDPQIQKFFTLMANGQFKMTGDAKEFYETVNNLSLSGFKDNINSILKQEERLKTILSTGELDYFNNIKESLNHPESLTADSQVYDLLAQAGYDVIPWLSNPDWEAIDQMRDALQALEKQGLNLTSRLQELDAEFYSTQYAIFSSADSMKELHDLYSDAIEDLNAFGTTTQQNQAVIKAYNQALIDLNNELDLKTLNIDELSQYADYLQEIAQASEDLSDDLINNADAAEIVAKSIMKMNDGFEALGKDWDSWIDILQNSTASSEQFEIAMLGARDALAQLLDVSRDYVTNDFVKQHLDLITEASNGSANAIDGLKQALTATIVQGIINENALQGLAGEIWSSLANIQAQIPNFEVGMELNDGKFLAEMQNFVNLLQLDADQINALFDSLGFEPTFVTEQMPITQEIPASQDIYKEVDRAQFDGVDSFNRQFTASFPIVKHYAEDTTETIDGFVDVPALSTNGVTPQIKTITKKATPHFSNYSTRNAGGSATPKKQTKTKTKSQPKPDTSTKETKKAAEDDRDIYREINLELDQISRQLSRIQKKQQRLFGKQLIDNLNQQSKILDQHRYKLREKQKLQQADLAHRREQLRLLGLIVNEQTGDIENYLDALGQRQGVINGLINQYNAVVGSYNATTDKQAKDVIKDQLTEIERAIKDAKTEYKKVQSEIKEYDSIRKSFEDITDQLEEQLQKQVEINITKFRMQLEIRLDLGEAERDWNKFRREVLEGTDVLNDTGFDTLYGNALQNYRDVFSYFDVHNSKGSIQNLTEQLNNTRKQIELINEVGESAIYGDNKKQAMEDLQNDLNTLMGQMENIESLVDDIDEAYLNTIDDIKDQFDLQIEDYEFVGDLIEHDIDLLQLVYGENQYDAMNSYYNQLQANQNKQLDSLKQQAAYWKQLWDSATNLNDAKKFKENYEETIRSLNSLIETSVKNLQDKYVNAINKIFDALDRSVSGGLGSDYLSMEWELMNKNADEYLDTINSAFAIQELQYKYEKAINDTTKVRNQKVLTDLMNEQLGNLREKDKLTQYDVDRAEKLLQIEQARLALQDAQNNKTSLKLRRDSQGNYSYVYTADQDAINQAEQDLAKAQNDLYNFDKTNYQKNLDDMLSAWKDFQAKYKEIVLDTSLSEEDRIRQLALLRDQYGEYINNKVAENEVIRNNLLESAFMDYAALYEGDYNAYMTMIENEKDALMGELVPAWAVGIQQMTDTFAGNGGFIPTCEDAFNDLSVATEEYQSDLAQLEAAAGINFENIKEGIDEAAISFSELIEENDALIERMRTEMDEIKSLRSELTLLLDTYKDIYDAAKQAAEATHNFLVEEQKRAADEAERNARTQPEPVETKTPSLPTTPTTTYTPTDAAAAGGSGTITGSSTSKGTNPWSKVTGTAEGIAGNIWYYGSWKNQPDRLQAIRKVLGSKNADGSDNFKAADKVYSMVQSLFNDLNAYGYDYPPPHDRSYYETYDYYTMLKKYKYGQGTSGKSGPSVVSLASGGYTGAWGSDGRLAMLHQKELVLNASDTKNILDSVSILRNIVATLGGNISNKLGDLNSGYMNTIANRLGDQLDQNVNIQANFPNVNSKREIEEAFSELVNLAAQRALKTR